MKTINTNLLNHLKSNTVTVATLWQLERKDGVKFFITSHDRDLEFGGQIYEANTTFNQSATEYTSAFSVDNFELEGVLNTNDGTLTANSNSLITLSDITAGVWDNTKVKVFIVNFEDLTQGALQETRGTFGKFSTTRNKFKVEFRGSTEFLTTQIIKLTQPLCNANFCDKRCGLVKAKVDKTISEANRPEAVRNEMLSKRYMVLGTVEKIIDNRTFFDSARTETNSQRVVTVTNITKGTRTTITAPEHSLPAGTLISFSGILGDMSELNGREFIVDYLNTNNFRVDFDSSNLENFEGSALASEVIVDEVFKNGKIKFLTGNNINQTFDVSSYRPGTIILYDSLVYPLVIGDEYELIKGCSKTINRCETFGNVINFRGTPHIKGVENLIASV